jgi:hypothetical protein
VVGELEAVRADAFVYASRVAEMAGETFSGDRGGLEPSLAAIGAPATCRMLVTGSSTELQSRVVDMLLAQPEVTSGVRRLAGGRVIEWRRGESKISPEVAASRKGDADPAAAIAVELVGPAEAARLVATVAAPVLSSGLVLIDAPSAPMPDSARAVLLGYLRDTADAVLFVVSAFTPLERGELAYLRHAAEQMERVIVAIAAADENSRPRVEKFAIREQVTRAVSGADGAVSIVSVSLPAAAQPAPVPGLAALRARVREAETAVVAARVRAALQAASDVASEDSMRLLHELDAVRAEAATLEEQQQEMDRRRLQYQAAAARARDTVTAEGRRELERTFTDLNELLGRVCEDSLDSLHDRLRGTGAKDTAAWLTENLAEVTAQAGHYLANDLAWIASNALSGIGEGSAELDVRVEGYRLPDLAQARQGLTTDLEPAGWKNRRTRESEAAAVERVRRFLFNDFRDQYYNRLDTLMRAVDSVAARSRESLSKAERERADAMRARGGELAAREQELQPRLKVYQELSAQAEAVLRRVAALSRSSPGTQGSPGNDGPASGGDEAEKYMVGECPGRVRAGAEFSLIVSFTDSPADHGVSAGVVFPVAAGADVPVTLVVHPDAGLAALGDLQQTVTVPRYGDSAPARFAFRARAEGPFQIRVTAWLGGTFLAELRLEISAEGSAPPAQGQRRRAALGALQGDPGEVTLQVHFDRERYSFQLLSQRYLFGPVLAQSLTEKPGEAVERTVAMLRKMARDASGYSPAMAARWVRETGIGLWQDLVPRVVQEQFWLLRDSITAFTIAGDKDPVPWELLYPAGLDGDAGFLVEQFPVLRRVYDQSRAPRIWLGGARYVIPPDPPAGAHGEVAAIGEILGHAVGEPISDLAALLDLLDTGAAGMLHFACHSSYSAEAGGSSIRMADGSFIPQLLNGAVAHRRLAGNNPLVFINACRTATATAEYTQMRSWASQFMAAGAGAFIGTLWPVRSTRATSFATAFYSALAQGSDLGQAAFAARQTAKDDGDPTWLGYTVYGDPTAYGSTVA